MAIPGTRSSVLAVCSLLWLAQLAQPFTIQCERCRCVPDFCSQNVPQSMCPCTNSGGNQQVACNTQTSSTSSNGMQQLIAFIKQYGQKQTSNSNNNVVIPSSGCSSTNGACNDASSWNAIWSMLNSNKQQTSLNWSNVKTDSSWNVVNNANSNQLVNYNNNAQLVLRVPIVIIANCGIRENMCPYGSPSIQAVDNCNKNQDTKDVRCITLEEVNRYFICTH